MSCSCITWGDVFCVSTFLLVALNTAVFAGFLLKPETMETAGKKLRRKWEKWMKKLNRE